MWYELHLLKQQLETAVSESEIEKINTRIHEIEQDLSDYKYCNCCGIVRHHYDDGRYCGDCNTENL